MARDYKHRGRVRERRGAPGWLWGLAGLMVGLLVALLVYLKEHRPEQAPQTVARAEPRTPARKPTPDKRREKPPELRYEFYTLLPESEVVIPDQELETPRAAKPGKPSAETSSRYMLQAGSFRRASEAENMKARLALLGIESSIQHVTVGGDDWHRVRIGPFTSMRQVKRTRDLLRRNRINAIPVKISGK